jgi:hypothetical protein
MREVPLRNVFVHPSRARGMRRSLVTVAFTLGAVLVAASASAGPTADENAKPGNWGFDIDRPGNALADGVVDLYPAAWSIARGDTVRLKIRSTTSYDLKVYRLGWYDGAGAREVLSRSGLAADLQPYPSDSDPKTGLMHAGWKDSVTFPTDASWTPGMYVARIEQPGGKQALTYFVIRDDGSPTKMPILLLVTAATHQAYNGWPGPSRGGKSLYGFNSSSSIPTDSVSSQAVKVSRDRPFLVGGGTADVLRYEYPFLRWAEKNGYDVAYANDEDLEKDPTIAEGRKAIVWSGHWEYVSKAMHDATEKARDTGTHLMFMSGDTLAWQVRYEDGGRTMVGYKEGWRNDPEHLAGVEAMKKGDKALAESHFVNVTRGWKALGYFPSAYGIDLRRPGIRITGVLSNGGFKPVTGPWGHLRIATTDPWFFEGTGFKVGDVVRNVMGYEYDSMMLEAKEWDPFRPEGQVKLGALERRSDGTEVGSASYYKHKSGAEVVAFSAVNFAYVLDDYAALGWEVSPVDARMQKLVGNLLTTWSKGAAPDLDAGPIGPGDAGTTPDGGTTTDGGTLDAGPNPIDPDVGVGIPDDSGANPLDPQGDDGTVEGSGGCSTSRGAGSLGAAGLAAIASAGAVVAAVLGRRRRKQRAA